MGLVSVVALRMVTVTGFDFVFVAWAPLFDHRLVRPGREGALPHLPIVSTPEGTVAADSGE